MLSSFKRLSSLWRIQQLSKGFRKDVLGVISFLSPACLTNQWRGAFMQKIHTGGLRNVKKSNRVEKLSCLPHALYISVRKPICPLRFIGCFFFQTCVPDHSADKTPEARRFFLVPSLFVEGAPNTKDEVVLKTQ